MQFPAKMTAPGIVALLASAPWKRINTYKQSNWYDLVPISCGTAQGAKVSRVTDSVAAMFAHNKSLM